jgi:hypothetical protein
VSFFFDALAELRAALRARGSDLALLEGDASRPNCAAFASAWARARSSSTSTTNRPRSRTRRGRERRRFARLASPSKHRSSITCTSGATTRASPTVRRTRCSRRTSGAGSNAANATRGRRSLARDAYARGSRRRTRSERRSRCRSPKPTVTRVRRIFRAVAKRLARAARCVSSPTHRRVRRRSATAGARPARRISRRTCAPARSAFARASHAALARARTRAARARPAHDTWLGELIWRDFYQQMLVNVPRVATEPFDRARTVDRVSRRRAAWNAWTAQPAIRSSMRRWCNSTRRLDAQPLAHDRRVVSHQGSAARLSARRSAISNSASPTATSPRTTAAGSGRHRPGPMPRRTFASSIQRAAEQEVRSRRRVHALACCRRSRAIRRTRDPRAVDAHRRSKRKRSAFGSVATIPRRSSTISRRAAARSPRTRPSWARRGARGRAFAIGPRRNGGTWSTSQARSSGSRARRRHRAPGSRGAWRVKARRSRSRRVARANWNAWPRRCPPGRGRSSFPAT